jgi:general L-amino acid transport system ATP-binding protein
LAEASNSVVPERPPLVVLDSVNKWFGKEHVLSDVSLSLARGERLVICGPSGSGKSTLLRCINGLERHQSGRVVVDGVTLTHHAKALEEVRRNVGMVFQSFNLFQHLTVLENCLLAPIWVRRLSAQQAEALAIEYLHRVHMQNQLRSYPSQLSGGQQQRVAIARALCMEPKMMMFDEPTSALDPEMTREVLDIIVDLSTSGMTMICVTHEMGFARRIADRMIFIDRGQITEQGSPVELFERPQTERLKTFLNQVLHAQGHSMPQ